MKYRDLNRVHAGYDRATLERYGDLFAGGSQLRSRIERYLPRHAPVEPIEVWRARLDAAHYLNYCGPIGGQLAAWLFTAPFDVASTPPVVDPWWAQFRDDADGLGTDLAPFLRARFLEALVHQRAWWRVEFPEGDAADRATYEAAGLGAARLCPVCPLDVTNWRRDDEGRLRWVVVHTCETGLEEWEDEAEATTETWTLWRADDTPANRTARRWEVRYAKGAKPKSEDVVPEVEPPENRVGGIPLVELALPRHLWLMDHLADAALESFRKRNALSWALDRSAFAQLVLKRKDRKRPPPLGTGYFIELGTEESLEWAAPPSSAYDALATYAGTLKDEIYRVVALMASGVDNNAAAIGRSGESKAADQRATEIVLTAYGERVREAAEKTYDLVARGRGEALVWSVSGLDRYQVTDTTLLLEDAVKASALGIPSATAQRALLTRAALALVPDADEATRQKIRAEIDAAPLEGLGTKEAPEVEPPEAPEGEPDDEGSTAGGSVPPPPPNGATRAARPAAGTVDDGESAPPTARPRG